MGCCASRDYEQDDQEEPELTIARDSPLVKPITLLVTGGHSSGVTSLCGRFFLKRFPEGVTRDTVGTGARDVVVNGHGVLVTLVDSVDKARENNIDDIDGILYAIDCATANDSPFAGIFRRIDNMYTQTDRRRAYLLKHSTSLQSQDSESKSVDGAMPRVKLSMGAGQMNTVLQQTNHEFGVVSTAPLGAGACASSERANHNGSNGSVGMPMVALNDKGLAVRTTRSPKNESMQDLHQPLRDSIPPLHVVLTKADKLVQENDRHRIRRVRAMASNWSLANRCSVSFVSAKTGQGMEEALSALIRDVVWRRHAEMTLAGVARM